MNTLLPIGLLIIYLITCIGYYRSLVYDIDFMNRMSAYNKTAVIVSVGVYSVFWPIFTTVVLFFKGLSK